MSRLDREGAAGPGALAEPALVVAAFLGMQTLAVNFAYPAFAGWLLLSGFGQGMFSSPNTSAIMSGVPAGQRGVASGMRSTFQNSGTALSIGVFFSRRTPRC